MDRVMRVGTGLAEKAFSVLTSPQHVRRLRSHQHSSVSHPHRETTAAEYHHPRGASAPLNLSAEGDACPTPKPMRRIATDMIKLAWVDNCDTDVLLSSDKGTAAIIEWAVGRSVPKSRKMTRIMVRQTTASQSDRPPVVRDPHDRRDDPKTRLNLIRLRSHRAIARKIDADPSLLDIPLRNLDRWRALRGEDHPACAEWRGLLAQPWESVRALLVSDTEESARLRQSSPFTGILSAWERRRIHETT